MKIRDRVIIHKTTVLAFAVATLLPLPTWAAPPASGGSTCSGCSNVTSTVVDGDTYGLLLFRSDDYNGTGEASYSTGTASGNSNILSFIDGSGVWYLNLYPQKTGMRTVYITPNHGVTSSEKDVAPPQQYWQNVEVTSKCMNSMGQTVPFANLNNGSSNCTFGIDFGYNGVTYKLLIGRTLNASDPAPGSASVACNAANTSNECTSWTITAGSSTAPGIANLYSYTGSKSAPWVFIGQYYNSVRVNISN